MEPQASASPQVLKCPQCGGGLTPGNQETMLCPYCGSSLIFNRPAAAQTAETVVRGMRLKPFHYTDTQGTGLEVFSMLVPSGWNFTGG